MRTGKSIAFLFYISSAFLHRNVLIVNTHVYRARLFMFRFPAKSYMKWTDTRTGESVVWEYLPGTNYNFLFTLSSMFWGNPIWHQSFASAERVLIIFEIHSFEGKDIAINKQIIAAIWSIVCSSIFQRK